jgi:peptide/nickel transport system ATP-binding protein
VAIARALALDPAVIICDEPTSALDVTTQARVLSLFKDIQKATGVAYLFISHDLGVVNQISDRIAVLYRGQIVELGDAHQVSTAPRHDYTHRLQIAAPVADPKKQRERRKIRLALLAAAPHDPGLAPVVPA